MCGLKMIFVYICDIVGLSVIFPGCEAPCFFSYPPYPTKVPPIGFQLSGPGPGASGTPGAGKSNTSQPHQGLNRSSERGTN